MYSLIKNTIKNSKSTRQTPETNEVPWREMPWNQRHVFAFHEQRYRQLQQIAELNSELEQGGALHLRFNNDLLPQELSTQSPFNELLNEKHPTELLIEQEQKLLSIQALLLQKFSNIEINTLKNIARSAGSKQAEEQWNQGALKTPQNAPLSAALSAFSCTFFGSQIAPPSHAAPFIVLRSTASELSIELTQCAHTNALAEIQNQADSLCLLHAEWANGYLETFLTLYNSLNTQATCQQPHFAYTSRTKKHPRCQCSWITPSFT